MGGSTCYRPFQTVEKGILFYAIILLEGFVMIQHKTMPISEIIDRVTAIARKYNVKRLDLFGSFAYGNASERSDIDFIIRGCEDFNSFIEEIDEIPTLRRIDIFNYDEVCSDLLREDMDKYGKQIF